MFKLFTKSANGPRPVDLKQTYGCQSSLHAWGAANQVVFEATKESMHIVDSRNPVGDNFKILSVIFDPKLLMNDAVFHFYNEASWRLKTLFRVSRHYAKDAMVRLFKSQILSFVEGATPAIYHACPSTLRPLDDLFQSFLDHIEISPEIAILEYRLAPMCMRRDIAMLGLLHKVSLGIAPKPLMALLGQQPQNLYAQRFVVRPERLHSRQLHDPVEVSHPAIIRRSVFGLIKVYNNLPEDVVAATSCKMLQGKLQQLAQSAANDLMPNWQLIKRIEICFDESWR